MIEKPLAVGRFAPARLTDVVASAAGASTKAVAFDTASAPQPTRLNQPLLDASRLALAAPVAASKRVSRGGGLDAAARHQAAMAAVEGSPSGASGRDAATGYERIAAAARRAGYDAVVSHQVALAGLRAGALAYGDFEVLDRYQSARRLAEDAFELRGDRAAQHEFALAVVEGRGEPLRALRTYLDVAQRLPFEVGGFLDQRAIHQAAAAAARSGMDASRAIAAYGEIVRGLERIEFDPQARHQVAVAALAAGRDGREAVRLYTDGRREADRLREIFGDPAAQHQLATAMVFGGIDARRGVDIYTEARRELAPALRGDVRAEHQAALAVVRSGSQFPYLAARLYSDVSDALR